MQIGDFNDVTLMPPETPGSGNARQVLVARTPLPDYALHQRAAGTKVRQLSPEECPTDAPWLDQVEDQVYLFGGVIAGHFGHFIAEQLHRLWPLAKPRYEGATVLFAAANKKLGERRFFREAMAYLGVQRWKVITTPHRIARLTIAQQGQRLNGAPDKNYLPFLKARAKIAFASKEETPKKIALLRDHLKDGAHLLGETDLGRVLKGNGYTLFRPEDHPLTHQLRTLWQAEKIVISEGSSCHLFDLLPAIEGQLAYLQRREKTDLFDANISPKCRSALCYDKVKALINLLGPDIPLKRDKAPAFADMHDVHRHLRAQGLLDPDAPVMPTPNYLADLKRFAHMLGAKQGVKHPPDDWLKQILAQAQNPPKGLKWFESWATHKIGKKMIRS